MASEGAGPSPPHSICDSLSVKLGVEEWAEGGRQSWIGAPFPQSATSRTEPASRAPETSNCHLSCLLLPGSLTSAGEGEGHTRADLFLTSPIPLHLSPAEPEMDTKSSVVWVAGSSTKFSKTVAGEGLARESQTQLRVDEIYS